MKHFFTRSIFALACVAASCSAVCAAELSGSITFVNDYLWDGISQNRNDPALQGGFQLDSDSGLYGGIWGSQVNPSSDSKANFETDWYFGWTGSYSKLTFDVGAVRYKYIPGGDNLDFNELWAGISAYDTTLKLWHSTGLNNDYQRIKLSHIFNINDTFSIPVEFTHRKDNESGIPDGGIYSVNSLCLSSACTDSYNHYKLGVGATVGGFYFELNYQRTNIKPYDASGSTKGLDKDMVSASGKFVISATYHFGGN